ncbi:hypothetical protein SLEP1_g28512 [Rubroshorea leprosula]|uniref:CRC domain-containing protein n=1 Tax=Rubroshorea leprosula TaxID=152421 RepID=A0AAV5K399_9ROSI|nr:hypothetical protein SLEP1_g28512 [Rubroshorea leprosula]
MNYSFSSDFKDLILTPQSSSAEESDGGKKNDGHLGCMELSVPGFQGVLKTGTQENDRNNTLPVQNNSLSVGFHEYSDGLAYKNSGTNVNSSLFVSGQTEQNLEQVSSFDLKPMKGREEQGAREWPHNECPVLDSDHIHLASNAQQCKDSGAQDIYDRGYFSNELPPGPLQGVHAYGNIGENVQAMMNAQSDNMMQYFQAGEDQHGMTRRCLQFREQPTAIRNYSSSSNLGNEVTNSRPFCTTSGTESLGSFVTTKKRQLGNPSQYVPTMLSTCSSEKSPFTVPNPLDICLPLNSNMNSTKMDCGGTGSMKLEVDSVDLASVTSNHYLETRKNFSSVVDNISACPVGGALYGRDSLVAGSKTSEPFCNMEPVVQHLTLQTRRNINSEQVDSCEEFNQQGTKKKRKKSSRAIFDEGCKHCNCKRTKCLKLYCDCFAAGIFCDESCACQGCLNRPEYEDTVFETRQQIESRNPLAFAPKIKNSEDGKWMTPSSGKHKRGCNCKKSMCQKKYCECYQANVGCSSACRCDGCKNVYGKKEDYGVTGEIMESNRDSKEILAGSLEHKLGAVVAKKDSLGLELHDLQYLTPMPPSFNYSDHAKDSQKSQLLSWRYLPSPPPGFTVPSSHVKALRTPKNFDSNDIFQETSKHTFDLSSYIQRMDTHADPSPVPSYPSILMASSESSKGKDLTSFSRLQLCPRTGHIPSGGSPHRNSSLITPISELDETKNPQEFNSDGRLYDILEDDM